MHRVKPSSMRTIISGAPTMLALRSITRSALREDFIASRIRDDSECAMAKRSPMPTCTASSRPYAPCTADSNQRKRLAPSRSIIALICNVFSSASWCVTPSPRGACTRKQGVAIVTSLISTKREQHKPMKYMPLGGLNVYQPTAVPRIHRTGQGEYAP